MTAAQGSRLLPGTRALSAIAAVSLVLACERIEEPAPSKPPAAITSESGQTAATSAPKKRCVEPLPDKPKRALKLGPDPKCTAENLPEPLKLRRGKVVFPEAAEKAVAVEVAETNVERMRGLMFRREMPEDQGMLFAFQVPEVHTFWMRNTCLPLDMVFIDEDGFVVGIEENTTTMSDEKFSVPCASKYVLEVNAGFSRKNGVKPGQKVRLEGI